MTKLITTLLLLTAIGFPQEGVRFDETVRQQFFNGLAGDTKAMEKGMEITTKVLAANPNHAEAMVWHGTGVFFKGIAAFQRQDFAMGMKLNAEAITMMDKAVALEPKSIGVRIPRGANYLAASRYMPKEMGAPLLVKALEDYEACWQMQKEDIGSFSEHSLGELLLGLSEGHLRAGNVDKSKAYADLLKRYLPESTTYMAKVDKVLAGNALSGQDANCAGCHYGSPKVKLAQATR